jgi:hypothetical protein
VGEAGGAGEAVEAVEAVEAAGCVAEGRMPNWSNGQ